MEQKRRNPEAPAVGEIDAPTGLDLHPEPPPTVRISKRAALFVLFVLCGLAGIFAYGVYRRPHETANGSLTSDPRRLAPATMAAGEITKDIPAAVINLAAEDHPASQEKTATGTLPQQSGGNSGKSVPQFDPRPSSASGDSRFRPPVESPERTEPTPKERRLAEAYDRELQAISAPTAIRSNFGDTTDLTIGRNDPNPPSANDDSPLAALAQLLAPKAAPSGASSGSATTDREFEEQNMQAQKEAFLAEARKASGISDVHSIRTPPVSEYEIKAGWEIPAVLEQQLNSDLPGELKALIAANVYDTATGRHLLIPQGARLLGTYDSNIAYGQNGLQVVWHRIIYPDASSIDLGGMVGQDSQGSSGFRGDVDNHFKRLIGLTALSSLFSAGFQLSQSNRGNILQNPSVGETVAGAAGQEIGQLGAQITRRNLNIQPTIHIPTGYKFNVRVSRDLVFDSPYEAVGPVRQ